MTRRRSRIAVRLTAAFLAAPLLSAAGDPPPVLPQPTIMAADAGFVFEGKTMRVNETRQSVSGIACSQIAATARGCSSAFADRPTQMGRPLKSYPSTPRHFLTVAIRNPSSPMSR